MLATEGTLWNLTGIELIECTEIVESDHRRFLTDVEISDYFAEEFVEGDLRCITKYSCSHVKKI